MSATDSLPLTLARTTATAGLGFAVGITASIVRCQAPDSSKTTLSLLVPQPLWTFPALYAPSARNTAVDRLRAWSGIYSSGKSASSSLLFLSPRLIPFAEQPR